MRDPVTDSSMSVALVTASRDGASRPRRAKILLRQIVAFGCFLGMDLGNQNAHGQCNAAEKPNFTDTHENCPLVPQGLLLRLRTEDGRVPI